MEFLAFDLETTGVVAPGIVSGAVVMYDQNNAHVLWSHEYVANPPVPITPNAASIHGYTNEYVQIMGRPHVDVVQLLTGYVYQALKDGIPVVAFNARFDITILDYWARTYGFETPRSYEGLVDPLVIDRAMDTNRRGKRTLGAIAAEYGIAYRELHNASADAELAGLVWLYQLYKYPILQKLTLETQQTWYRNWAEPRKYSTDWPIDHGMFQLSHIEENGPEGDGK